MSAHFAGWDESTLDLAIERFTVGQDLHDEARLDRLANGIDLLDFENALAAIHLGALVQLEAPQAETLSRLEVAGRKHVVASASAPEPERGKLFRFPSSAFAVAGWLVAAALVLTIVPLGGGASGSKLDTTTQRATLIADAGDLVRIDWTATDDPAAAGAGGDVVWSSSQQEGYMRFENLAPNDPAKNQYQLWIFDPTRLDWEAKPVDGGVFDVAPDGTSIVPIDPKLTVRETALFAVTLEVPGGVVVSERVHLVLTAAL